MLTFGALALRESESEKPVANQLFPFRGPKCAFLHLLFDMYSMTSYEEIIMLPSFIAFSFVSLSFLYANIIVPAVTNRDGGSSIEANESQKSHEKIGNSEQSMFLVTSDGRISTTEDMARKNISSSVFLRCLVLSIQKIHNSSLTR